MALYNYKPLDENVKEIRLLTLMPGPFSADIHVLIHHAILTPHGTIPVYEALSYVWGSSDNPVDIKVGPDGNEAFSITQNLATALPYLRYEGQPRVLWIDAICIDQKNIKERGHQVGFMGDIYKQADRVVVWLGPERDDSTYALELIATLGSKVEADWTNYTLKSSLLGETEPDWADGTKSLPYREREWLALGLLFRRPWFERLWVRQEIGLARPNAIIICGTATVSWQAFRTTVLSLVMKPARYHLFLGDITEQYRDRLEKIYKWIDPSVVDFTRLLRSTVDFGCSDPRDRVYAILGLLHESERGIGLKPDYSQTTLLVYQNVALRCLDYFKRLDFLTCCEMREKPGTIPTWVPNWLDGVQTKQLCVNTADANSPAFAQYVGNGVLKAAGLHATTIQNIEECNFPSLRRPDIIGRIQKIVPRDVLVGSYAGGGSLLDGYCRTLCMDEFAENWEPPAYSYPTLQSSKDFVTRVLLRGDKGGVPDPSPGSPESHYCSGVFHACRNRSIFTTTDGYIGLAPKAARSGDEVCILLGCESPLVLRKAPNNQYQIVGESFLCGMMTGEALLGPLPEEYREVNCYDESSNKWSHGFKNFRTEKLQEIDPRFHVLSGGECVPSEYHGLGKILSVLTPERLKGFGVNIIDFELV